MKRHRAQALAAAAAVAVATTVLAASLSAGQAAQAGITEVAFDVLGETDELVRSEGDFFFPQPAAEAFAGFARDERSDLAIQPAVVHPAVAGTEEGLTEPDSLMIGFPAGEEGFGSFEAMDDAGRLSAGSVLVNEDLAEPLGLEAGQRMQLRFAEPMDPLVPTIHTFRGNITAATPPSPVPGLPTDPPAQPTRESFHIEVEQGATRVLAALIWQAPPPQPENSTDLDLALVSPSGQRTANTNGSTGSPDSPALLDLPISEPGTWTAEVTAKASANQPFGLAVVVLRPAFTLEELREGREQLEELQGFGGFDEALGGLTPSQVREVQVAGVVSGEGKGGFLGEPAVFLPIEDLQRLLAREGEVNLVRVSNPGDVRGGLAETDAVMPVLEQALERTKEDFPEPSVHALAVEPSKQQIVDRAERAGEQFTRFLTTLSSFTIAAGILLVINLFTMLGEERRVELSVMRALGMRRRDLVGSLTLEGTLYALPGAPIGALMGIGLAYGLIEAVNSFVVSQDGIPIPFVLDPLTILLAAVLGLAFTIVAVAITGWRMSKLHVASGLKNRTETRASQTTRNATILAGLGVLATLAFLPTGLYTLLVLGPSAMIFGGVLLVGRSWPRTTARFVASALVIPYALWTILAFDEVPTPEVPFIAPIRGILLVLVAVVALLNTPGLDRSLKGLTRRLGTFSPAAMVAAGYPTRRQVRTGLTASMFALILLVLAFFSTFFTVFAVDPAQEAGGYDIYAETRLPIEDLESWAAANLDQRPAVLDRLGAQDTLAMARVVGGDVITIDGQEVEYQGPPVDWFYGVDEGFVERNAYELVARQDRFETDRQAYRELLADPATVIVSRTYDVDDAGRLGRIEGGEQMGVDLGGRSVNLTVLGAQKQLYLGGVFVDRQVVQDLFPSHGTAILAQIPADQDPVAIAQELERSFAELGLDAESIEAEAAEIQELNARFFTVLQVFLGLGLVIGVASLGIVTAKSALEREHELGVMRAMGVPAHHITLSLVGEALFTALLGIIPGVLVGIAAAYAAYLAFFAGAGAPFSVPWASMFYLSLISLAATLLSTVPPARKAARTDVARAVRIEL